MAADIAARGRAVLVTAVHTVWLRDPTEAVASVAAAVRWLPPRSSRLFKALGGLAQGTSSMLCSCGRCSGVCDGCHAGTACLVTEGLLAFRVRPSG